MNRLVNWASVGVVITLLSVVVVACGQHEDKPSSTLGAERGIPATDDARALYSIGFESARSLVSLNLTANEVEDLVAGLRDGALSLPPRVKLETQADNVRAFMTARRQSDEAGETRRSQDFLASAAAEAGAQGYPSGLVYREIQAGRGQPAEAGDSVRVHYRGTLADGSVFDSSHESGLPAQFPLSRVIPCWTEGIQKMREGSKGILSCPAALAYGDHGLPPRVKPGAAVAFEIELLQVIKPSASND